MTKSNKESVFIVIVIKYNVAFKIQLNDVKGEGRLPTCDFNINRHDS